MKSESNIYTALQAAFNSCPAIAKDMTVGSGSYSYKGVSEKMVLNTVKPVLEANNIIVLPVKQVHKKTEFSQVVVDGKVKTTIFTDVTYQFKFIHTPSATFEIIEADGHGMDNGDKAAGKAYTYCFKNALLKALMLFSGEDTDNSHSNELENVLAELLWSVEEVKNLPALETIWKNNKRYHSNKTFIQAITNKKNELQTH